MMTSAAGIAALSTSEGRKLVAYQDGEGVWTIGRGITEGVFPGMMITDDEEQRMFSATLAPREQAVTRLVKVPMTQSQFDALVSLVYNIGAGAFASSTLLRLLNAGDYLGAADQFLRWDMDNGKHVPGLLARRKRERTVFLRDVVADPAPMPPMPPIPPDPKPSLLSVIIKLITSWFSK